MSAVGRHEGTHREAAALATAFARRWARAKPARELKGSCPQGADSVLWSELGYNSAMEQDFKDNPILNSPYHKPKKHWELDSKGFPTGEISDKRRDSRYFIPIPAARLRRMKEATNLPSLFGEEEEENQTINEIRRYVDEWRTLERSEWGVTPITARLLDHWRSGRTEPPLFFCQVEAIETFIWLNEVAPNTAAGQRILKELKEANEDTNSTLLRYAAKMATGAGKTKVMAMLIAYHTINRARSSNPDDFANCFLIVAPGITIKDRLRVLLPSDPSKMYQRERIVPIEFMAEIRKARILITNYHTFKPREKVNWPTKAREVLSGNNDPISTIESEEEMLHRACRGLLGSGKVIVINDEAHHCYRDKDASASKNADAENTEKKVRGSREEKEEIKKHNEAARLWISGIEALGRKVELRCVYDLSATPFFLRGSGYKEGKLFPWVVSDFALMDAIECGIVKLPRVPIDDGSMEPSGLPIYRDLYKNIKDKLPKKGRKKEVAINPEKIPSELHGALNALYGNYNETYESWHASRIKIPPVFIIVCNNTSTSKMIYDYISGYELPDKPGTWKQGYFKLFNNIGEDRKPMPRMNTLLIDSMQLDSGEAMSKEFKEVAANEIQHFKEEMRARFPDRDIKKLTDEDLLREVMNTVGKEGSLGEKIRCVVSVSMLTEGWDANNVTHILGVRAFGTQLLCEQVVGRGLRRYNYDLISEGEHKGHFEPEIADILGVPFSFMPGVERKTQKVPKERIRVHAIEQRSHLSISFPRVLSYAVNMPNERLVAKFNEDEEFVIKIKDAPPETEQQGIVGKGIILTLDDLEKYRLNQVVFSLAAETAKFFKKKPEDETKIEYEGEHIPLTVFRDLVPIVRYWMNNHLHCSGGTFPQYLLWRAIAVRAAEQIHRACSPEYEKGSTDYTPIVDPFAPTGTSFDVDFYTSKRRRHETAANKCHLNYAICDSDWELRFCKFLEDDPNVYSYIRNNKLDFAVPYTHEEVQTRLPS